MEEGKATTEGWRRRPRGRRGTPAPSPEASAPAAVFPGLPIPGISVRGTPPPTAAGARRLGAPAVAAAVTALLLCPGALGARAPTSEGAIRPFLGPSVPTSTGPVFPSTGVTTSQEGDSVALLRRARAAQRRFERLRVRHLPTVLGGSGGGCDDRVGRMCWRHGPADAWIPDPEPEEVTEARAQLLEELAAIAEAIPGDAWVAGQRVWYLGESGRWDRALRLARRCAVDGAWWCAALEGLALHGSGRYEEAEAAFDVALAGMGEGRAESWRDPALLLDREGRTALDRAREEGREEVFAARLWSLADPLWIVPGNERRSEHLARRTVAWIRAEAENPYGLSWGDDLEELLVRYGWTVAWERAWGRVGISGGRRNVIGREHPESRSYVPSGKVLAHPLHATPDELTPHAAYAPSTYAPRHAPLLLPAPSHLGTIPLGDSVVLVAEYRMPDDTTYRGRRGRPVPGRVPPTFRGARGGAGLVVRSPDGGPVAVARSRASGRGVVWARLPAGGHVVSVETWRPAELRAGRARRAFVVEAVAPGVLALSDLFFLDVGAEPTGLGALLEAIVLPPDPAPGGGVIRVGWALYGVGPDDGPLSYTLSLRREDGGILRRAGRWLGLVGDADRPIHLEWEERAPGPAADGDGGPAGAPGGDAVAPRARSGPGGVSVVRSLRIELPALESGAYVLALELETPGRESVRAERALVVR